MKKEETEKVPLGLTVKSRTVRFRSVLDDHSAYLIFDRAQIRVDVIFLLEEEKDVDFCFIEVYVEAPGWEYEEIAVNPIDDPGPVDIMAYKETRKLAAFLHQKHSGKAGIGRIDSNWVYLGKRGNIRIVYPLDKPVKYADFPQTATEATDMVIELIDKAFAGRPAGNDKMQDSILRMTRV